MKLDRIKIFPLYEIRGDILGFLSNCDSNYISEFLNQEIVPLLNQISSEKCPFFGENKKIKFGALKLQINMPRFEEVDLIDTVFCFDVVLKIISWQNLIGIFKAILLEKSVVFVSNRKDLLCLFVKFFMSLILPFQWCFPYGYFLHQDSISFLNSPIPFIFGLSQSIGIYKLNLAKAQIQNKFQTYFIDQNIWEREEQDLPDPFPKKDLVKLNQLYEKIGRHFIQKKLNEEQKQEESKKFLLAFQKALIRRVCGPIGKMMGEGRFKRDWSETPLFESNAFLSNFSKTQKFHEYVGNQKETI